MSYLFRKLLTPVFIVLAVILYFSFNNSSVFYKSALKLHLNSLQQDALLRIFNMAGYLNPDHLWRDMNKIHIPEVKKNFNVVYDHIIKSGANKSNIKEFNPKIMGDGICYNMQEQDCIDLIL